MRRKRKSEISTSSSKFGQRRGKKRGLSPVIATVLLIGTVVVIGLIIFMWFRGLTQEAIIKFDQNVQLVCDDVKFEASYTSTETELAISNIGNVPIFGLIVKISEGGSFQTTEINEIADSEDEWASNGLDQGKATSVDMTGKIGSADTITLTPILKGIAQSGGQKSFSCDEALHGQQISL